MIIRGLGPADFRAKISGKVADITSAEMISTAPWTVLVLDSSGSMLAGSDQWRATLRYADGLISSAPAKQRLALVVFSGRVTLALGFGAGSDKLKQTIRNLQEEPRRRPNREAHGTALFDSLAAAAELVPPGEEGVLLAITHGLDTRSKKEFPELRAILLRKRLRLFAFVHASEAVPTPEVMAGVQKFSELVEDTGGLTVRWGEEFWPYRYQVGFDMSPDALNQLDSSAASLNAIITHPYKLEFRVAPQSRERLKLDVIDKAGKKRRDLRVFCPHEIAACPEAAAGASH